MITMEDIIDKMFEEKETVFVFEVTSGFDTCVET
jgi:hypothetical protein